MDDAIRLKGKSEQGDVPEWGPLRNLVGMEAADGFMWMYEVVLEDESRVQVYKHIDTRRYLHLDNNGRAFSFEAPNFYRHEAALELAELVLPRLEEYDLWSQ